MKVYTLWYIKHLTQEKGVGKVLRKLLGTTLSKREFLSLENNFSVV